MGISVAQLAGLVFVLALLVLALLAFFVLVVFVVVADADDFDGVYVTGTPPIVNAFIVFR